MNYERLRGSDYRFVAVCLLLLASATWFSVRNFYRAFPEASIDFRVGRQEGQRMASEFLGAQGYRTDGYRAASSFGFDDDAKTFLEREAGLEQANRIMGSRVRLWHWSYRWFRPLQKEELRAEVTPRGEVVGFSHEIAEDAATPEATAAQARVLAEEFLRARMKRDPAALEFVEGADTTRPHRVDRSFTWKERDFSLHDATYRIEVTVLGNEVGGYREYLKIPEQWTRDYQRLRSKNEVAQLVDSAFLVLLVVGLVVVIVMRVRQQDVRWRRAATIGVIGMALSFLAHLNGFSMEEFRYPTTDSYSSFVVRQMLQGVINALGVGGLLFVLAAGAEPLYREAFRNKISLGSLFRLRGLRTRRFFLGAILGITLTAVFVAYQTAFYIVAYRYGAWSPADVPYDDLLNTRFPWLFVLIGGYMPAISEEFLFRMFGIPFLRKLVRSTAAAVVMAGFLWGFGHAGYPQQPFFIRGVEVGIGGVVLGFVMLRWGILPTLVWHYSVDAMYSAMLLLRSNNLYYRFSGAASAGVIVLPVIVALAAYWRRGGFALEAGLLNGDEEAAVEAPEEQAAPVAVTEASGYRPLSTAVRISAWVILGIGLAGLFVRTSHFGDSPRYKITEEQALAKADAFLRAQGLDPGAFRHVTFPATHWEDDGDTLAGKYFLEKRPLDFASRMFERYRPMHIWATRYFKALDREEVNVSVHPESGKILGFRHTLPEDRAGADITTDAARRIAANFAASMGWDVAAMDLKEDASEKKKVRRDYSLEWEARAGDARNLEETKFRVAVGVSGDQVTAARGYWKIPEAYSRARSRQNFISITVLALRFGVIAGGFVWGLLLLIQNIRKGMVRWRRVLLVAASATTLMAISSLLALRLVLQNYNTAIPLQTFQAMAYIGVAIVVALGFVMMAAVAALITSFYPESWDALKAAKRRILGVDAAVAIVAAEGLWRVLHTLRAMAVDQFHADALLSVSSPNLIATTLPALAGICGAYSGLLYAALLALAAVIAQRLPKAWMKWSAAAIAVFMLLPLDIRTPGEFALQYGIAAAIVAAVVAFCVWFGRKNYLAYAVVFWYLALRGPVMELIGTPIGAMKVQGWIVQAVLVAGAIWAAAPALRREA